MKINPHKRWFRLVSLITLVCFFNLNFQSYALAHIIPIDPSQESQPGIEVSPDDALARDEQAQGVVDQQNEWLNPDPQGDGLVQTNACPEKLITMVDNRTGQVFCATSVNMNPDPSGLGTSQGSGTRNTNPSYNSNSSNPGNPRQELRDFLRDIDIENNPDRMNDPNDPEVLNRIRALMQRMSQRQELHRGFSRTARSELGRFENGSRYNGSSSGINPARESWYMDYFKDELKKGGLEIDEELQNLFDQYQQALDAYKNKLEELGQREGEIYKEYRQKQDEALKAYNERLKELDQMLEDINREHLQRTMEIIYRKSARQTALIDAFRNRTIDSCGGGGIGGAVVCVFSVVLNILSLIVLLLEIEIQAIKELNAENARYRPLREAMDEYIKQAKKDNETRYYEALRQADNWRKQKMEEVRSEREQAQQQVKPYKDNLIQALKDRMVHNHDGNDYRENTEDPNTEAPDENCDEACRNRIQWQRGEAIKALEEAAQRLKEIQVALLNHLKEIDDIRFGDREGLDFLENLLDEYGGIFEWWNKVLTGSDPYESIINDIKQRLESAHFAWNEFVMKAWPLLNNENIAPQEYAQAIELLNAARRMGGLPEVDAADPAVTLEFTTPGLNRLRNGFYAEDFSVHEDNLSVTFRVTYETAVALATMGYSLTASVGTIAGELVGETLARRILNQLINGAVLGGVEGFGMSSAYYYEEYRSGRVTPLEALQNIAIETALSTVLGGTLDVAFNSVAPYVRPLLIDDRGGYVDLDALYNLLTPDGSSFRPNPFGVGPSGTNTGYLGGGLWDNIQRFIQDESGSLDIGGPNRLPDGTSGSSDPEVHIHPSESTRNLFNDQDFDVLGHLGSGTFGDVYKVEFPDGSVDVVKVPDGILGGADPDLARRALAHEITIAEIADDTGWIPRVEDIYNPVYKEVDGRTVLEFADGYRRDFIDGKDVRHAIRDGDITPQDLLNQFVEMQRAFEGVGDTGLRMWDIDTGNFLVDSDGNLRLIDPGALRRVRSTGEDRLNQGLSEIDEFKRVMEIDDSIQSTGWDDITSVLNQAADDAVGPGTLGGSPDQGTLGPIVSASNAPGGYDGMLNELVSQGYTDIEFVGQGAWGEVYKLTKPNGEEIALKIVNDFTGPSPNIDKIVLAQNDIMLGNLVEHTGFVPELKGVFGGKLDSTGTRYVSADAALFDFIHGMPVDEAVRSGKITVDQAIHLLQDIQAAFAQVRHSLAPNGVEFADITGPGNILLVPVLGSNGDVIGHKLMVVDRGSLDLVPSGLSPQDLATRQGEDLQTFRNLINASDSGTGTVADPSLNGTLTQGTLNTEEAIFQQHGYADADYIGHGITSTVYKVEKGGDLYAAKIIKADGEAMRQFFKQEFEIGKTAYDRGLPVPQYVEGLGPDDNGGLRGFTMQYINGVTMDDAINRGTLTVDQALSIADGLRQEFMNQGIQLRDHRTNFGNFIIENGTGRVYVIDLGGARLIQ